MCIEGRTTTKERGVMRQRVSPWWVKQTLLIAWFWRETFCYRKVWELLTPGSVSGSHLCAMGFGVWRAKQAAKRVQKVGTPRGDRMIILFVEARTGIVHRVSRSFEGKMCYAKEDPSHVFGDSCFVACTKRAACR